MKILQVFDFLSLPHGGGTVDIVYKLSRALGQMGYEVTICVGDYELDQEYLDSLVDVKVKVFHSWFNKYGFYIMPRLFELGVTDYDVIHLHCYRSFQNVVLCSKARMNNVPYIIDAHGSTVDLPGTKRLIRGLYDKAFGHKDLKYASRVIAETEIGVAEYKKLGVNSGKCVLLHPLFDTKEYDVLPPRGIFRKKYNIEYPIILFVGRINWAKGIETLVESVYRLGNLCLVIVGQDDGFKQVLERIVVDRGIHKNVLFTGFLSGYAKLAALVDADILVQPSMNEAGARPSLEAILCNTPVIVTRNTGAGKEIAKLNAGYLVGYGDVDELSHTIQYILENYDEVQVKTQRAKGYIKANLSLDKQIGKYEELYSEVSV